MSTSHSIILLKHNKITQKRSIKIKELNWSLTILCTKPKLKIVERDFGELKEIKDYEESSRAVVEKYPYQVDWGV